MRVARLLGESSSAVVLPETAYVRTLYKQSGGINIIITRTRPTIVCIPRQPSYSTP